MKDNAKKIAELEGFLRELSRRSTARRRAAVVPRRRPRSSIPALRKTISIITVCGHVQPHHSRPKAVVNMMMPVMKMSIATAKMTMSCGQKSWPRMENRRSTMFIMSSGLPLNLDERPGKHDADEQPAHPGAACASICRAALWHRSTGDAPVGRPSSGDRENSSSPLPARPERIMAVGFLVGRLSGHVTKPT